jgi:hypothetical protein
MRRLTAAVIVFLVLSSPSSPASTRLGRRRSVNAHIWTAC